MGTIAGIEQAIQVASGSFGDIGAGTSLIVRGNFNLALWGTFSATVVLERSFDGGVTWLPVTFTDGAALSYTGPMSCTWSEPEAGVLYRPRCSVYSSGTVYWRVSVATDQATATPINVSDGQPNTVPTTQLNILGGYNATTNTPTIATAGTGAGAGPNNAYVVTTAGTVSVDGIGAVSLFDYIMNAGGTKWVRLPYSSILGSMSQQNATAVAINGGSITVQALGVDTSSAKTVLDIATPAPRWSETFEDASGNVAGGLDLNGAFQFQKAIVNSGTAASHTITSGQTIGAETAAPIAGLLSNILAAEEDGSGNISRALTRSGSVRSYTADPAYAAHNKARRSEMVSVSPPLNPAGCQATANTTETIRSVWTLDADFDWVRLIFVNDVASGNWSITSAAVAATSALGNYVAPTGGQGWQVVTFNNAGADVAHYAQGYGTVTSASNMQALAPNPVTGGAYGFYASDWVNCRSLARTDGGNFALLMASVSVTASSGSPRALSMPTTGGPVGAGHGAYGASDWLGGRVFQSYAASGDYTSTNQAGFPAPSSGGAVAGYIQPCIVQAILRNGRSVTFMMVGDSIAAGVGGYLNYGMIQKLTLGMSKPLGTGLPIHLMNLCAQGGAAPESYFNSASGLISLIKPQVLIMQMWGRNGTPVAWKANANRVYGDLIIDSNGNVQKVTAVTNGIYGTTGGSAPTWATSLAATTTDNSVTWTMVAASSQKQTQEEADYHFRSAMNLAYRAEAWGCVPILMAPVPGGLFTGDGSSAAEPFRVGARALVLKAAQMGVVTFDFEDLLGSGVTNPTSANPNLMQASLSLAGAQVHPNDLGQSLMAARVTPKIRAILDLER